MEKESVGREETNELLFQSDFNFGDGSYHSNFPEASSESEDEEECSDLPDSILAHLYFTSSLNTSTGCSVIPQELEERYQRSLEVDSSPTPLPWYGNRTSSSSESSSAESSPQEVKERIGTVDHIIILSSDSGNSGPDSSGKTGPSRAHRLKSWPCSPLSSTPAQPPPAKKMKKKVKVRVERRVTSSKKSDDEGADGKEKQTKRKKRSKRKKKNKLLSSKGGDSESKEDATTGLQSSGGEGGSVPMVLDSDCEILAENPAGNLWEIIEKDRLGRDEYERRHGKGFQRYSMKSVRCNNCRQKGHIEDTCPQPKRYQRCYLCGEINHLSSKCQQSLCQYCFQPNHRGRPCHPQLSNPRGYCTRCYMGGHRESVCPDVWRQFHNTTHMHDHLVKIPPEQQRKIGPAFCYKCGRKGHFGFECHQPNPRGYPQPMLPLVARYDRGVVVNCRRASDSRSPSSQWQGDPRYSNQLTGRGDNHFEEDRGLKWGGRHHRRSSSGRSSRRESGEISDSDDEDTYADRVEHRWVPQEDEGRKRPRHGVDGEGVADHKRRKFDHHPGPPEPFLPLPTPPPPRMPFLPGRSRTDPGRPLLNTPPHYPCPPPLPQFPTNPLHRHSNPSLTVTIPARDPSHSLQRSLSTELYRLPDDNLGPGPQTLSRRRYVHDYADDQTNFPRTPFSPEGNDGPRRRPHFPPDFPPFMREDHADHGASRYGPNDGSTSWRQDPHYGRGTVYDEYNASSSSHHRTRAGNAATTKPERRFSSPSPAQDAQQQRRNSRGFVSSHSSLHRRVSLQF